MITELFKYSSAKILKTYKSKGTFGTEERFNKIHFFFKNKGKLRSRQNNNNLQKNIDHLTDINKTMKRSKTILCIRKNKKLEIDTKNNNFHSRNIKHNLSNINNKSSNCITPGSFNPWINYKSKENKEINIRNQKNKDHFYHMNPTEIHKYKPMLKRTYNYFGSTRKEKVTGIKSLGLKNVESKEEYDIHNITKKRFKCLTNTPHIFFAKNLKIYEYEPPVISYKDLRKIN